MSELKVNTIQPAAGSQITVQAQVLGVPGTDPNHFATVSQLGSSQAQGMPPGAAGITRSEAEELIDSGVASANRYADENDVLQTEQANLNIAAAVQQANSYTDSEISKLNFSSGLLQKVCSRGNQPFREPGRPGYIPRDTSIPGTYVEVVVTPRKTTGTRMFLTIDGYISTNGIADLSGGLIKSGAVHRSFDGGTTWELVKLNEKNNWLILYAHPSTTVHFGNGFHIMGFDEEYYNAGGLQGRTGNLDGNVRYRFEWDSSDYTGDGTNAPHRTNYLSIMVDELEF